MCNAWCFTPTFLTVIVLSSIFFNLQGNPHLEDAFMGIRASIVALIVYAGFKISKTAIIDKTTFFLMAFMLSVLLIVHLHPILIIISGAILGFVAIKVKEKLGVMIKLEKTHNSIETKKEKEGA